MKGSYVIMGDVISSSYCVILDVIMYSATAGVLYTTFLILEGIYGLITNYWKLYYTSCGSDGATSVG
jgi:hypothetical protein